MLEVAGKYQPRQKRLEGGDTVSGKMNMSLRESPPGRRGVRAKAERSDQTHFASVQKVLPAYQVKGSRQY